MSTFIPEISLFQKATSNVPMPSITFLDALALIAGDTYKKPVAKLRSITDKKERDQLKKQLPAVTWSGVFSKRNSDSLVQYSNIICQDIDGLNPGNLPHLRKDLEADPYVLAVFVSPSGEGLKVLFRVQTNHEHHSIAWEAIAEYLDKTYGIICDEKCKDICRLCFLSYDPDLFYNLESVGIDTDFINQYSADFSIVDYHGEQHVETKKRNKPEKKAAAATTDRFYIDKCYEITQKTQTAGPGAYNKFINVFALQANRYGIQEGDVMQEMLHFCSDHDPQDTKNCIKSVYKRFSHEHGKWLREEEERRRRATVRQADGEDEEQKQQRTPAHCPYDDSVRFWCLVTKEDKTGNKTKTYQYLYNKAAQFLQNNGFYKYRVGDRYQLIHVDKKHHIAEIVTELRIKEFMVDYLQWGMENEDLYEFDQVLEMFRRGLKNYVSVNLLDSLRYYRPEFKRDTAKEAYVYFKNCFLQITADSITRKHYTELTHYIWRNQLIDFEYNETDYKDSDVYRFIWYAITGRRDDEHGNRLQESDRTEEEHKKIKSAFSTIGYLLHRFKDPTLTKAVVTTDKQLRNMDENNGRSGKSLYLKCISQMVCTVTIDGRNFSFDKDFAFQKVNIDTGLINFDDVKPNFDFSRMFSMLTEEFSWEKKRLDLLTLPYSESPKVYVSSNRTLKGSGQSAIARQQILEFSTYFNADHTPAKEFGHMFFYQWDQLQWCQYYSLMLSCLQLFLKESLLPFPLENYAFNKLVDTCGEEFVEYLDDTVLEQLQCYKRFDKDKLYNTYKDRVGPKGYCPKKNTFSAWIKLWADIKELTINAHKAGGRDRSNGIDYVTFTTADEVVQVSASTPAPAQNDLFAQPGIGDDGLDEGLGDLKL